MYGGQIDERALEKTQQQHMLYQQEQHHQILQQQIQVGLFPLCFFSSFSGVCFRADLPVNFGGDPAGQRGAELYAWLLCLSKGNQTF